MATKTKTPPPRARGEKREGRRALIAAGVVQGKSVTTIAGEMGISREWASREINNPETQSLIRDLMKPHHDRLKRIVDRSISNVERALEMDDQARLRRVEWLSDRIERMRKVIEERSADPVTAGIAGGSTGLIVHTERVIGSGDNARLVDEYEVDAALLKELREHERQLRDELNDFGPNLKAVERARDLLELAEGKHKDGDNSGQPLKWQGQLDELLVMYHRITTARGLCCKCSLS